MTPEPAVHNDSTGLPAWIWLPILAAVAAVLYVGRSLLVPFVIGLLVAYLLNPLVLRLQQRGVARTKAVALLCATMMVAIATVMYLSFSTIQTQGLRLIQQTPTFVSHIEIALDDAAREARSTWPSLAGVVPASGQSGWLLRAINTQSHDDTSFADTAGTIATVLIFTMVFSFFLLRDGPLLVDWIVRRIHPRHIETSVAAWAQMDLIIGQYLRGVALESAAVGVLSATGLWALEVPFPLLLGIFTAAVNPVPYVGVAVSLTVVLLVGLTAQMSVAALGAVVLLFVVIRLLDDVVLVPLTVGRSVHLHPLFVIVSIVIGEHALGVLGMVLAVPAVTVVKEVIRLLIQHRRTLSRTMTPRLAMEEIHHIPL